ncbi:Speedy protein C [Armadillidium vulgare]|nr:Speedy protein C [Armadillidium vulgare]
MRTAVVCIQSKNKKRYKQLRVNETQVSQNEASVKKLKTNNSDQTSSPSNKPSYYTRDIIRSLCDTIKSSANRLFSIKFFDKNEENRENKENEMPSNVTGYKLGSIGPFCHLEQISKPDFSMLNMVPLDKNKLCIKDPEYVETVSSRMTLASLKRYMEGRKRLLRRSKTAVLPTHAICSTSDITKFVCLIEKDPMISLFLKRDICRLYADKYLLAMVLIYFARAHLTCYEFSRENFFAALYLAHDMEEDHEEIKYEVFPYCLGTKWKTYYTYLLSIRDDLFWAIDCRAVVSKKCCEQFCLTNRMMTMSKTSLYYL